MWKCPICKTDNQENRICIKCGFDDSSNYLHHKTIGQLPDTMLQKFVKDVKEQSVMVLGEKELEKTLKKVTCIYCDNEWYVEKEKKDQVKVCPFCKKAVETEATFKKIQRLLVEETGITENYALEITNILKNAVHEMTASIKEKEKTFDKPPKKQEMPGVKVENEVKLTYKECSRLKGLSWNAGRRFDVPEGYTHIMEQGLAPVRWEVRELRLPKSLRYIAPEALKGCRELRKIIVHPQNQHFVTVTEDKDGAVYEAVYDRETDKKIWPIRS